MAVRIRWHKEHECAYTYDGGDIDFMVFQVPDSTWDYVMTITLCGEKDRKLKLYGRNYVSALAAKRAVAAVISYAQNMNQVTP